MVYVKWKMFHECSKENMSPAWAGQHSKRDMDRHMEQTDNDVAIPMGLSVSLCFTTYQNVYHTRPLQMYTQLNSGSQVMGSLMANINLLVWRQDTNIMCIAFSTLFFFFINSEMHILAFGWIKSVNLSLNCCTALNCNSLWNNTPFLFSFCFGGCYGASTQYRSYSTGDTFESEN